jgi:hypothetical protein
MHHAAVAARWLIFKNKVNIDKPLCKKGLPALFTFHKTNNIIMHYRVVVQHHFDLDAEASAILFL